MTKQHRVKTARPRIVPLDCGYAVDVDGLTILLKRNADGWLIDIDDGVMIGYRRDANDVCHITIEREQDKSAEFSASNTENCNQINYDNVASAENSAPFVSKFA